MAPISARIPQNHCFEIIWRLLALAAAGISRETKTVNLLTQFRGKREGLGLDSKAAAEVYAGKSLRRQ